MVNGNWDGLRGAGRLRLSNHEAVPILEVEMRKRIWINPEFMNWHSYSDSVTLLNEQEGDRAYEIWEHASTRLQNNPDEMDRTDAITTLKRCVNQRLQVIEKLYKLRAVFASSSNRYLQLLERLLIVRPLLILGLMEVRNEIEHQDKRPPKVERCLELLDIVWYFLRTTDRIVQKVYDSLVYDHDGDIYGVTLGITIKRKWNFTICGWLPKEFVAMQPKTNFVEILADELHTNEKLKRDGKHLDKKDSDLYFRGEVIAFPNLTKVIQQYFRILN